MAEPLIWLPLNGDLRNNGLNGTNFTNNASSGYAIASIDNGKTGKCYSFDGHNWLSSSSTVGENMTNWTIACWICPTELDSTWRRIGGIGKHTRFHLDISSANWPRFFCSKDGTTSNYVACNATGNILQINTWYHLCGVVSDKYVRLYINGEQISSTSRPDDLAYFSADTVYVGSIESGNRFIGKICDFRIYDTALSDYEIKLLSQNLLTHLCLDRNGLGGENIISGTYADTATEGSWAFPTSSYSDKFSPTTLIVPSGSQYVLSFDAKSTVDGDKVVTHFYSPNTTTGVQSSTGFSGTGIDGYCVLPITTEWKRYWVKYTQSETTAVKHVICPRLNSTLGTGTVSIRKVKLEAGTEPTPWCPSNTTDTTVYDTSGFGNNATAANVTYSGDTARYTASSVFVSGSKITLPVINCSGFADSYTFAWWEKSTDANSKMAWGFSNGNRLNLYRTGGYYCWNTSDGANNKFGTLSTSLTADGNWHHLAVTGDGTTTKLYIDGEFKANATTYKPLTGTQIYISGWDTGTSYYWDGSLSDFRIYGTALSAEDICELYKVSAKIDRKGTMYSYGYVEE